MQLKRRHRVSVRHLTGAMTFASTHIFCNILASLLDALKPPTPTPSLELISNVTQLVIFFFTCSKFSA